MWRVIIFCYHFISASSLLLDKLILAFPVSFIGDSIIFSIINLCIISRTYFSTKVLLEVYKWTFFSIEVFLYENFLMGHISIIVLLLICDCQDASTLDNIEDWRWKLTMLMRNKDSQEVVTREKKDRRDFGQLSALATRIGLHRFLRF